MKRRITFVHGAESPFDPDKQAKLSNDVLSIRELDAAKEERLTFGFDELPGELWQVLKNCHELHIRWATERPYDAVVPFSSRVSPGLHVFYTPVAANRTTERLCPLLKKIFAEDLKCLLPEISFTAPPILSQRFASTSALQFHSLLPSLADLVTYIQHVICGADNTDCQSNASSLLSADSVDIDYDSISHSLTVSALWSKPPEGQDGWTEEIRKNNKRKSDKIEVGLLAAQKATDLEELSMGGFLVVIGEDKKLKPTLFSFPSRHHPLPEDVSYTVSFESPTGLHPTLKISIPRQALLTRPPAPPDATCALHTYLTLPSTIFADKYQLSTTDPLFLNSHHLVALRSVAGETDLEAPDWVVPRWGSNLLLELATPAGRKSRPGDRHGHADGDSWNITIPLHLRYLEPSQSGYRSTSVPWPVVFWACTAEDGTKMGINPFDRVNLGWEGLFGPRTMFFQLHPSLSSSRFVEDIQVPVLKEAPLVAEEGASSRSLQTAQQIELGTVLVIVLGFVWVLWRLGLVVRSSGIGDGDRRRERERGPARSGDGKKDK
ncbi:hypothetical protein VTN77DRAFT_782 [Rasamsonia byssochlamydoides]|uniref:uncharacterized protein n=1 Tax=Rasamsonia byssochlamydoides TaxID=89139 RepID=UPI00374376DD